MPKHSHSSLSRTGVRVTAPELLIDEIQHASFHFRPDVVVYQVRSRRTLGADSPRSLRRSHAYLATSRWC